MYSSLNEATGRVGARLHHAAAALLVLLRRPTAFVMTAAVARMACDVFDFEELEFDLTNVIVPTPPLLRGVLTACHESVDGCFDVVVV